MPYTLISNDALDSYISKLYKIIIQREIIIGINELRSEEISLCMYEKDL